MPTTLQLPELVALVGCPAYAGQDQTELSGLWRVIEFMAYEPSAYVHEDLVTVMHPDAEDDDRYFGIPMRFFVEQVWPKRHAAELVAEREMEWVAEQTERAQEEAWAEERRAAGSEVQ